MNWMYSRMKLGITIYCFGRLHLAVITYFSCTKLSSWSSNVLCCAIMMRRLSSFILQNGKWMCAILVSTNITNKTINCPCSHSQKLVCIFKKKQKAIPQRNKKTSPNNSFWLDWTYMLPSIMHIVPAPHWHLFLFNVWFKFSNKIKTNPLPLPDG